MPYCLPCRIVDEGSGLFPSVSTRLVRIGYGASPRGGEVIAVDRESCHEKNPRGGARNSNLDREALLDRLHVTM